MTVLAVACARKEAPAGQTLTQEFWPTEAYGSEAGAAKKVVLSSFETGRLDDQASSFRAGFRAERFAARPLSAPRVESGVVITDWLDTPVDLDADAFREDWNKYLDEFEEILPTEVHTWEVQLRPGPNGEPSTGFSIGYRECCAGARDDLGDRQRERPTRGHLATKGGQLPVETIQLLGHQASLLAMDVDKAIGF